MEASLRLTIVLLLLSPFFGQCQKYLPCQLTFKDGTAEAGYVKVFHSRDEKIYFKPNLQSKREKINTTAIQEIWLTHEEDTLIFQKYKLGSYKRGGAKLKLYYGTCWANKIYETDKIEAFQFPVYHDNFDMGDLLIAFNTTSSVGLNFLELKMNIGVRFPELEAIVDVAGGAGTKGLDAAKFRRRLKNYLIRHCLAFRKIVKTDDSDSIRNLKEYLDYYTEVCGSH